jgi:hypothetical protein
VKYLLPATACLFLCCLLLPAVTQSQPTAIQKGLFRTEEVLSLKLTGDIRTVLNDRDNDPKYHPLLLSYPGPDSNEISIPVKVKTRGHFRKAKSNCLYPPLLINFSKKETTHSPLFKEQDKLKLVMPCRTDEYITREWLIYKLYNLITPQSFRARLVRVTMDDTVKKKQTTFYGILLEEEEQMARRNKMIPVKIKKADPKVIDLHEFLTLAVFEYMIGNTDWSVEYQQNIQLIAEDSLHIPVPVPYDFDHCGLVNANYAKPADELEMRSVTERRYRGYCITDMKVYDIVIALFNRLKKDIYAVYTSCSLLDARYIKTATRYLDDFYSTIKNPKNLRTAFSYPCDPKGTGNVIIKGLRKN